MVETDGLGNAYSFTEISDFEYDDFCSAVLYSNELTKLSPAGEQLWSKAITGKVNGFAADRAGNTYLAGIKETCSNAEESRTRINFIRKYAPDGSSVWSRGPGNSPGTLTVTPWGSVFVTIAVGKSETKLNRYDVAGRQLWSEKGDDANKTLFARGHVYLLDTATGYGELRNRLDKYDSQGNLVWSRDYVGAGAFLKLILNDLTVDLAGNIIMVGDYDDTREEFSDENKVVTRKVDATGKTLWTQALYDPQSSYYSSYSSGNRDNGGSIYVGSNGGGNSQVSRLGRGQRGLDYSLENEFAKLGARSRAPFSSFSSSPNSCFVLYGQKTNPTFE